jgi:hypothetical protein
MMIPVPGFMKSGVTSVLTGRPPPSCVDDIWARHFKIFEETTISIAIAWNVWKQRIGLVLNALDEPPQVVLCRCIEDIRLWLTF